MAFIPGGKYRDISAIFALTASAVDRAFAPAACRTARAAAGLPLNRMLDPYRSVPSSVRPTSRTRTVEPSELTRRGMAPNSSGVRSRLWTMTDAFNRWPLTAGAPPNWPAETSTL